MRGFRTGDLFLENTWSLQSLLEHASDPEARWSNAGFFIVSENDSEDESNVRVCLLTDGQLQFLTLDEVLRRPHVQAAAYRQLNASIRSTTATQIESYLGPFISSKVPIIELSGPFQDLVKRSVANLYNGEVSGKEPTMSTLGTLVDSKGRDLRAPGFSKGNPNSASRVSFTAGGLISATLSQIGLTTYDPQTTISDVQAGGILDQIYGNENPLFPRSNSSDPDQRAEIIAAAQAEVAVFIAAYLDAKPQFTYEHYRQFAPKKVNAQNRVLVQTDNRNTYEEDLDGASLEEQEEQYGDEQDKEEGSRVPTQMSNYYQARRRQETTFIAEEKTSDTLDKKLRQQQQGASLITRPKPGFRAK